MNPRPVEDEGDSCVSKQLLPSNKCSIDDIKCWSPPSLNLESQLHSHLIRSQSLNKHQNQLKSNPTTATMSFFDPAPPPPSMLGHYRLLGAHCGLRVSPVCLGGMSFGDAWSDLMGSASKSQIFALLDHYRTQGGNFIDLANSYQDEQAESWVGEWMESRQCRDEMVIATKYTIGYKNHGETKIGGTKGTIGINYGGNGAKSMRSSLDASLKKLRTTYIDLFYVHCVRRNPPPPFNPITLNKH